MPLNSTDKTTLRDKILGRYSLTSQTYSIGIVEQLITEVDLYLEEKYPDIYFASLTASTLKETNFIKLREYFIVYQLFYQNPDFLFSFNQSKNLSEVQNSAGTRVKMHESKKTGLQIADLYKVVKFLFNQLGINLFQGNISIYANSNVLNQD